MFCETQAFQAGLTLPLLVRVELDLKHRCIDAKRETQRRAIRKGPNNTAVWYLVTSLFPGQRL